MGATIIILFGLMVGLTYFVGKRFELLEQRVADLEYGHISFQAKARPPYEVL